MVLSRRRSWVAAFAALAGCAPSAAAASPPAGWDTLDVAAFTAADPPCAKNWDGGDGDWGDGSKWGPNHNAVPVDGERACLPDGSYAVTLTGHSQNLNGITVGAGVTLSVSANLANAADAINRGTLKLMPSGRINATTLTNEGVLEDGAPPAATDPFVAASVVNSGTIRANAGLQLRQSNGTVVNTPSGTLTTLAGASLTMLNYATVTLDGAVGNTGTIYQGGGRLELRALTATGAPLQLAGGLVQPALDAAGTGTAKAEMRGHVLLAGDIGAGMTVTVRNVPNVTSGNFLVDGDRTNHGTLVMESDGTVSDVTVGTSTGTPTLTNLGTIEVRPGTGGARFWKVKLANGPSGLLKVAAGTVLTVDGNQATTLTSSGSIDVAATGGINIVNGDPTFTQTAGTITVGGFFQHTHGTHVHQGGTVAGGNIRLYSATQGIPSLDPSGPGGPTFEVRGTVKLAGNVHAAAKVIVRGIDGATGNLDLSAARTNLGTIELDQIENPANTAQVSSSAGALLTNDGLLHVTAGGGRNLNLGILNHGTLRVDAYTTATLGSDNAGPVLTNDGGTVELNEGIASRGGYRQISGTTRMDQGAISVPINPGFVDIQGGVLSGHGTIVGPLRNAGEIQIGTAAKPYARIHVIASTWQFGVLNPSSYTQTSTGVLTVGVNGVTAGTTHDQLEVDGPADLAGTLEVTKGAYALQQSPPDRFVVVKAGSRTGTFATTAGLGSGPFALVYGTPPEAVVLEAGGAPPVRPQMDIAGAETTEGDSGTKDLTFTVKLSAPSAEEVHADWSTVADSATAPADFTASSGQVSFAPGQTERTVTVPVVGDTAAEGVESFLVRLRLASGADLRIALATGRILPDDLGVTGVRPVAAGDAGTSTLTIRGGGFAPGTTVRLKRAGEADRVATMIGEPVDAARLLARVDFTGAAHGAWDVVVQAPGAGGASVTVPGALEVVGATAPRIAVAVDVPATLRYGWPGRLTVSLRNEGTSDAGMDMLRVIGEDVTLRTEAADAFVGPTLDLMGDDLTEALGGLDVIPPGETRRVLLRFKSTTLAPHATLRLTAEAYPTGHIDAVIKGIRPDLPPGRISGHVRDGAGNGVAGVTVTAASPTAPGAVAETGPDGAYVLDHLAIGAYEVGIGSEPTASPERHDAVLTSAAPAATVDFSAPVSTVAGSVRSADGTRLANARVTLLHEGTPVAVTGSDGGGGFRFTVLQSGAYKLVAVHPTGGMARLGGVDVVAGTPRTGLALTTGDRRLDVKATGPGGVVSGATVFLEAAGFEGARWRRRTGADGIARFDGLPAGALTIEGGTAKLAPDGAQVEPGPGTTNVELTLTSGTAVAGSITASGSPAVRATAIAVRRGTGFQRRDAADAAGHYDLEGLPAGTYDLWFVAPGLAPKPVGGVEVTGAVPVTTVDAALTTDGKTVPVAVAGAGGGHVVGALFSVRDKATGASLLSAYSDESGAARLGPLAPGDYVVDVEVPDAMPASHELTVGAKRRAAEFDPDTYVYPYTPIRATGWKPNTEILNRPARTDWLTQVKEPQRLPKHTAGWHLENTTTSYEQPCPEANRLSAIITQRGIALGEAFDAWHLAWVSLQQLNQSDVNKYLAKSAELGVKLFFLGKSLDKLRLKGLDPVPDIDDLPEVGDIEVGLAMAGEGYLATYMQQQASGEPLSAVDVAEKAQEALEVLRHADTAYNGNVSKLAGPLFDVANAARDIYKLTKEVEELPKDAQQRSERYLKMQWTYSDVVAQIDDALVQFRAAVARCPDDDDDGKPAPGASASGVSDNAAPNDPNDILGPAGVGAERWIPGQQDLGYQVRFENKADASAPAVLVTVTHTLDEDVDLDSVELGDVGWGSVHVPVPGGLQSYHADVPQADGDTVRVDATLDRPSRTLVWTLTTIDPTTGDVQSSPTRGFLPPEDGSGNGQGYVSYGARGKPGLAHATKITAQASIVFDFNPPIATPVHENAVDAAAPASAFGAVSQPGLGTAACKDELSVQWSGSDAGSGLAGFDVWVSIDGGAFEPWLAGTQATSGTFAGDPGHTYAFYSVARDRVGLAEAPPPAGEAEAVQAVCDRSAPLVVPTVTGPAAVGGWRPGPVDVRLDALDDDGGLGVANLVWSATGATTGGATVGGDTVNVPVAADGVTVLKYRAADTAGNTDGDGTLEVRIDTTAPAIAVTAPAEGARYATGQAAAASFTCSDAGSGVDSCAGTVASGAALDTATPGEKTFKVTAVDKLGHETAVTRTYTVATPAAAAPTPSPTPSPTPVPSPQIGAKPVSVTLARLKAGRSAVFTVRSLRTFGMTGRAALLAGTRRIAPRKTFTLAALGKAKLSLKLDARTRKALARGKTVTVSLKLELQAGSARKTVTKKFRLRARR